jgi:uncharacterized membrane protein
VRQQAENGPLRQVLSKEIRMQGLLETIQKWHVHPAVDHFTVAILLLAVLTDLIASMFSTRLWLRYAALALIIVGTAAAWGSNLTGGWEADRVWKAVKDAGGPAYDTLHRHAELGDWLPWVFLVLSVWRIGVQLLGFMAGTRGLYLIVAILAAVAISYQGYLGGKLVYEYGIGTAIYGAGSSPAAPQPEASGPATPIPTVYVPAAAATPAAPSPTAAASAEATASAMPSAESASATPSAAPSPAAEPSASPAAASGH